MHREFILASSSKSRKAILKKAGIKFIVRKPLCNEDSLKKKINKKNPVLFVKKLSYEKAKSVSTIPIYNKHIVIGCDTIVYFNNKIFDKAKDIKEAHQKIKTLSGKSHKIISALTVCINGKRQWDCHDTTFVKFRKMSDDKISKYLRKTGEGILSSVGCYQIENLGPTIIENIRGDFFNVMGLPLFKLLKYLS